MTGKRIEFIKKPSPKETSQYIDNWVSGKIDEIEPKTKRTTIYLPENLHKSLKIQAANNGTSMTEIIIEILEKNIK